MYESRRMRKYPLYKNSKVGETNNGNSMVTLIVADYLGFITK